MDPDAPLRPAGWGPALLDLSRVRQALLSVAQPALGALLALGRLPMLRVMALGLLAACAGYLAVFSLNDVLDRRADRDAIDAMGTGDAGFDLDTVAVRHPLARGVIPLWASVAWVGALAALSAVCALLLAPACLLLFLAAVMLEVAYCLLRSVTWTKTIVSGVMVGVGGLAGWVAVAPLTLRAAAFFAFLALWEIAGRNLPNDLADLATDAPTGIRTVATVLGPAASARGIVLGTGATLLAVPALGMPLAATALALTIAVWAMGVRGLGLLREPTAVRAAAYFNRASLLPALVFTVALAAVLVGR